MDVLATIEEAFAGVERPPNEALLHPQCADDGEIMDLYRVDGCHDMSGPEVENSYSALSFLSPEGFRYFIPAYLAYCVRNPESPAAVIDSTVWAFYPLMYQDSLRDFVASKFALLDDAQRSAVGVVLEFLVPHQPDAAKALDYWRSR